MNFISFFLALALAALALINFGSKALEKADALQTDLDSMASVRVQQQYAPQSTNELPEYAPGIRGQQ